MGVTRLGLQIPSFTCAGVPDGELFERVAAIAGAAEESGFDSVWVMDHLYQIVNVGIAGDPDTVCEQVAAYFDAGLDGLVFNMHDAQDLEPVRLAGRTLSAAFG